MSGTGEERRRGERAQQVALFRYQLIREAADPALSTRQRGRLVCELAARAHPGPFGDPVSVSRATIDRWIRAWRAGGFDALVPAGPAVHAAHPRGGAGAGRGAETGKPGADRRAGRADPAGHCGWSPSARTLQRHFERLELRGPGPAGSRRCFGRFEAARPNELWTGDALHGPPSPAARPTCSPSSTTTARAVMAARWGFCEDTVRLAAALRPALAARGVPEAIYVDNGSAFVDAALKRAAAPARHQDRPQCARPAAGPRQDRAVLPHRP